MSNAKQIQPVALINKGNICYANSILQILGVMSTPWNRVLLESNTLSAMLRAISLNMAVKSNANLLIHKILWALKRKLFNMRHMPFDFNT